MLVRIFYVTLALLLAGCASTPQKPPVEEKPGVVVQQSAFSAPKPAERLTVKVPTLAPPESQAKEAKLEELVGEMPAAQIKNKAAAAATLQPSGPTPQLKPNMEIKAANGSPVSDVVLNFDNADIYEVLNVFSEILGYNYWSTPGSRARSPFVPRENQPPAAHWRFSHHSGTQRRGGRREGRFLPDRAR